MIIAFLIRQSVKGAVVNQTCHSKLEESIKIKDFTKI